MFSAEAQRADVGRATPSSMDTPSEEEISDCSRRSRAVLPDSVQFFKKRCTCLPECKAPAAECHKGELLVKQFYSRKEPTIHAAGVRACSRYVMLEFWRLTARQTW